MHRTRSIWMLLVMWAVALPAVARHLRREAPQEPLPTVRHTLDPNTAAWWELTALPRVGESIARAIVSHRETVRASGDATQQVFTRAEDLAAVRGIGPVTVRRIAPHLHFADHDRD